MGLTNNHETCALLAFGFFKLLKYVKILAFRQGCVMDLQTIKTVHGILTFPPGFGLLLGCAGGKLLITC